MLVRRTTGIFIPVSVLKKVHERKVILPVTWQPQSLTAILDTSSDILEYPLQFNENSWVVALTSKNDSSLFNSRAAFVFRFPVFGDAFLLIKHWNGSYWQSLDFTSVNLQSMVDSVYLANASQPQFHFEVPQTAVEAGVAADDDDDGSEGEQETSPSAADDFPAIV